MTTAWVRHLSKEYPTIVFQASLTYSFVKGSLMQILRQFDPSKKQEDYQYRFHKIPQYREESSVINALRKKTIYKVDSVSGETKVRQYITLTKRIYLIDCPGIVYDDLVLKGVIRPER